MSAYSLMQARGQLDRFVDEALNGEIVTILRDGQPVVTLTPTVRPTPEPQPIADEFLDGMRKRALDRPGLGSDSVTLVREMRDEER